MKKTTLLKTMLAVVALSSSCTNYASTSSGNSTDLKDILSGASGALGNIVEGVFTKTDLTVDDIAGEWTANGSAVSFQSDNYLKKAGGVAVAGAVEKQLDQYYQKYGLNGAVLQIDNDGNFTLTIKKIPLKGTVSVKSKGEFNFNFTAMGTIGLGTMPAYVEKTPSGLNVMFDADKIKKIMTVAASLSGSKMVSAADELLKQYDGICIGFKMTGKSASSTKTATDAAVDALKGIFGK